MKVQSAQDLEMHIRSSRQSSNTEYFRRSGGGFVLWDRGKNLTIISDGEGAGTVYRDRSFDRDFARLIRRENEARQERGLSKLRVQRASEMTRAARPRPSRQRGDHGNEHGGIDR